MPSPNWTCTEKSFYLAEFRERVVAMALPDHVSSLAALEPVLSELAANRSRVVLVSPHRERLSGLVRGRVLSTASADWLGALWAELQKHPRAALLLEAKDFARRCGQAVLRMRPAKLVWLDEAGGFRSQAGGRISVLDLADLEECVARGLVRGRPFEDPRKELLSEIRDLLAAGLPAVNLCRPDQLERELFTYAGAGSFCTRRRYVEVRSLALDEFDAAADLVARGVEEGYLVAREERELQRVLCHGVGVFLEGRYLAGIGALLPHSEDRCAEVAALYTLTRYGGEGVGAHLVRFALERAAERGDDYVFACTTSKRVQGFFERHGFARVASEQIPAGKWRAYDVARRARLLCLRHDLDSASAPTPQPAPSGAAPQGA